MEALRIKVKWERLPLLLFCIPTWKMGIQTNLKQTEGFDRPEENVWKHETNCRVTQIILQVLSSNNLSSQIRGMISVDYAWPSKNLKNFWWHNLNDQVEQTTTNRFSETTCCSCAKHGHNTWQELLYHSKTSTETVDVRWIVVVMFQHEKTLK